MAEIHKLEVVQKNARTANLPEDFCWFWEEYPRKKAKLDALKAWNQTANIRPDIEAVIAAIHKAKNSHDWVKDGGNYIPYPASWLRGGCWDDE